MEKLNKIFKKQGGFKLIKQYIKGGGLFIAILDFIFLGRSQTALEILRLSTQLKTKNKLKRKYRKKLEFFDNNYIENSHKNSNYIWICWLQGIENAPELVQKCYQNVINNFPSKKVILITENNMNEYVQFPNYITEKYKKGKISKTHLTDLLRLELLIKYGGLWLDSTVLSTANEKDIPDYYFDSDLFLYQNLKPGKDGASIFVSSWLISAKTNNKILEATRYLCYEYWKKSNELMDYFLLHIFLCICLEKYEIEWKRIIPKSNSEPHILLLRLFDEFDSRTWHSIKKDNPFHKLSYKFCKDLTNKENTYYSKIIKNEEE